MFRLNARPSCQIVVEISNIVTVIFIYFLCFMCVDLLMYVFIYNYARFRYNVYGQFKL